MKIFLSILVFVFSTAVFAQNNRGLVFNKDLDVLPGNWGGTIVYTDVTKNNTQVTLQSGLVITGQADSLALYFNYAEASGMEINDTNYIRIYDKEDKLSIDGEMYDIVYTARKGPKLIVVGEKQGFDNNRVADLRQTLTFGQANLNILKEVRYMENEFYFIRSRAIFKKK
ncbi:MAG: hypothetical protein WBO39_04230 [Ferruginibacter sp.]